MCNFDQRLLSILVCPATRTRLLYDEEKKELISDVANLAYPILSGVPVLVVSNARFLEKNNSSTKINPLV